MFGSGEVTLSHCFYQLKRFDVASSEVDAEDKQSLIRFFF